MQRVLVTGANRGIGLAVVEAYASDGAKVFATCRYPDQAADLHALARRHPDRVIPVQLDVTDQSSIDRAAAAVAKQANALDVLYNNAGILPSNHEQSFESITFETLMDTLRVNSAAPLMVAKAFVGMLERGNQPRIVNVSSDAGSLSHAGGSWYAYNTSKAALNMISRLMGKELIRRGIIAIAINPGWASSDMGGKGAPLTTAQSASSMKRFVETLKREQSGFYFNYDGMQLEW